MRLPTSISRKPSTLLAALVLTSVMMLAPSVASATTLTQIQVSAIIGLLQAFGVSQDVLAKVESYLIPTPSLVSSSLLVTVPPIPRLDDVYGPSSIGYDLSYATTMYPAVGFGFAVVGITHGKAFVDNPRSTSEFSWAKFGSAAAPTFYLNLNAPYGSTVAGHTGAPQSCSSDSTPSGEPTVCEGYNYGYQTAEHSFAYAASQNTTSRFWWLDIEEANSWSKETAVNDAVMQGTIDYLNTQGVRVGVYSTPRMWRDIAGSGFTPTQTLAGKSVPVPTWLPIGIMNQVDATNACITETSFMPGSPIWIVQYEANSTAIDQNLAC